MNFINFNYRRDISQNPNKSIAIEVLENHNIKLKKEYFILEEKKTKSAADKTPKLSEKEVTIVNMSNTKISKKGSINKVNGLKFLETNIKNVNEAYNSTPLTSKNLLNGKHSQTRNITITPRARDIKGITLENGGTQSMKQKQEKVFSNKKTINEISSKKFLFTKHNTANINTKSKKIFNRELNPSEVSVPINNNKVSKNLNNFNNLNKSNEIDNATNSSSKLITLDLFKQNQSHLINYSKEIEKISKSNTKSINVSIF